MSNIRTIAKNTFAVLLAYGMQTFFLFLLTIYIARYLGNAELGKYSLAVGFTGLFAILINFGLNWVIAREVVKNKHLASEFLSSTILARLLLSILAVLLVIITARIMQYPHEVSLIIYIFIIYTAITGISSTFQAIFQAYEQMKYTTYIWSIEKLVIFSLGMLIFFLGYGLRELAFIFVIGGLANLILSSWICSKKFVIFKYRHDPDLLKYLIKEALPFIIVPYLSTVFFQVTIVMLFNTTGSSTTGIYSAAYYLLTPLLFVSQSVVAAIFPAMSKLSTSLVESLKLTLERSIKFLFILAIPVSIWVTFMADKIILLVFGDGYSSSILVLQLLIWIMPLKFISSMLYTTLGALGKQRLISASAFISVVFNLGLNLFLISRFGLIGAAISTLLAELLLFILLLKFVRDSIPGFNIKTIMLKPSASGAAGLFVYAFSGSNMVILLIGSTVLYFGALYLIGGLTKEDFKLINSVRVDN